MPVMKQLRIGSETYDTVGEASVTQTLTSGTKIATVTIDGTATDLYAPEGGSSIDPASTAPLMDGTAAVGTSAKYAREDHVHPHDTSKQDTLVSGTNIKTVNGESILGNGDLSVGGGGSGSGFLITITETYGSSGTTHTLDKTVGEIVAALEAGIQPTFMHIDDYAYYYPMASASFLQRSSTLEIVCSAYKDPFRATGVNAYPSFTTSGGDN